MENIEGKRRGRPRKVVHDEPPTNELEGGDSGTRNDWQDGGNAIDSIEGKTLAGFGDWASVEAYAARKESFDVRVTKVICNASDAPELFKGDYGSAPVEKGALTVITSDGEQHTGS
jgi:hypothetical protein